MPIRSPPYLLLHPTILPLCLRQRRLDLKDYMMEESWVPPLD